ncbi:MAG: cytochrome b N-terminal domain-containing protein [Bryobacteraceae bacterium]
MAQTLKTYISELQATRAWRSIFRGGSGANNLRRSMAVQQNVFLHLASVKISRKSLSFRATWFLGTLSLGTFLILATTGILLMLYYHPSVPQAYADMKDLQFVVSAGVFLRNLHRWSAHAMVFLVFAHMFKVFYRGAYRSPREFNWVVGSNLMSSVPVLGEKFRFLMLGGNTVNANALLRFYVLHCVILPVAAALLLAIHFWRIRKDGGLYTGPGDSNE